MTPSWLSVSLWISLYAVLWSYMEVEIEGKDGGWAKNLPSKKFFNTKFTWYHIIMNTVGIIGGLGPETTSEFYLDLVFSCYKKTKKNRPGIIISSVPLPYLIEGSYIGELFSAI